MQQKVNIAPTFNHHFPNIIKKFIIYTNSLKNYDIYNYLKLTGKFSFKFE